MRSRPSSLLVHLCALLVVTASGADDAAPAPAPADEMPDGRFTFGGRAAEDEFEGFADVLVPVWLCRSGLWFVNPRGSSTDNDEEETNLGLGYRHILPQKKVILGANVYYDSRWSAHNNRFDQIGFGLEVLTGWVDARANWYRPEDDEELIDRREETSSSSQSSSSTQRSTSSSTEWGNPYGRGNTILQDATTRTIVTTTTRTTTTRTTVTQVFEQFEEPLEGWDAEIGVRLPFPSRFGEARIFGGFYSFHGDFTETIEGFKGRLEYRLLPALILDAEVYEDKILTGYDYALGARLILPFDLVDLSHGHNPFAGTRAGFDASAERAFVQRLAEMVMRDPHIRIGASDYIENENLRQTTHSSSSISQSSSLALTSQQTTTVADDVTFVDGVNGDNANPGTFEQPKQTVDGGVNPGNPAEVRSTVFVWHMPDDYDENVVVNRNVNLIGQGQSLGYRGGYLGGNGLYPVVDGNGAPAFMIQGGAGGANQVSVMGFELKGGLLQGKGQGGGTAGAAPAPLPWLAACVVAASDVQNLTFKNNIVREGLIGLGAEYAGMPDFNLWVLNNRFEDLGAGVVGYAGESSGSAWIEGNTFNRCGLGAGLAVAGSGASRSVLNATICNNFFGGGGGDTAVSLLEQMLGPGVLPPLPQNLPGLGAIAAVAYGESTINGSICYNRIVDNLLGITAVAWGGSQARLGLDIHDNVLDGGGSAALLEAFGVTDVTFNADLSLAGITLVGVGDADLTGSHIHNNTISDHLLGIAAAGAGGTVWANGEIDANWIRGSLVGIAAVGAGGATTMDNLAIHDNWLDGGGSGLAIELLIEEFLGIHVTEDMGLPDAGAAGILALAYDGAAMNGLQINNNLVEQFGVGIGVAGLDRAVMNGAVVGNNTLNEVLVGIVAAASGPDTQMTGLDIHHNWISGRYLAFTADAGGTIPGSGLPAGLVAPDVGLAGILVAGADGANLSNAVIRNNSLNRMALGITVAAEGGARIQDNAVEGNSVYGSLVGILATADNGALVESRISGNAINADPLLDYAGLVAFADAEITNDFGPGVALPAAITPLGVLVSSEADANSRFEVVNNQMSGHAVATLAGTWNGEDVVLSNNTSTADNYFHGNVGDLTDGGDNRVNGVPTPVIILP